MALLEVLASDRRYLARERAPLPRCAGTGARIAPDRGNDSRLRRQPVPTGEVEFVNKGLMEYCGQGLDAMKQWGTNGTVHGDDLPHVVELFTRGITSGEPYEFDARIRRSDGIYRWFQVRGLPLRDMGGQIVRWYSLLVDIDDRKRAEAQVEQAYLHLAEAQRLSKTAASSRICRLTTTTGPRRPSASLSSIPRPSSRCRWIRGMVHPEDLSSFDAVIARGMTGTDVDFVFRIVMPRGGLKHVRGMARITEQIAGRPYSSALFRT
jgi:PAS domain S-box-containing protein